MKRKTLIIIITSYIGLIAVILVIGFGNGKPKQPAVSKTGEAVTQVSQSTPNGTLTVSSASIPSEEVELTFTPSPEPSETLRTSTATFELTSTKTPTSLLPTATQDAHPIIGSSTATHPPYPVEGSPTSTSIACVTPTRTKTPTRTPTPTPTSTSNLTSTPQTGWSGEWTIYWENQDGTYSSDLIDITLEGDEISAQATINNIQYDFSGELIEQNQIVEGVWSSTTTSGFFYWEMGKNYEFGGNWNNTFGFCGARLGENQPENCKIILELR